MKNYYYAIGVWNLQAIVKIGYEAKVKKFAFIKLLFEEPIRQTFKRCNDCWETENLHLLVI